MDPSAETVRSSPLEDGTLVEPFGDIDLVRSPKLRAALSSAASKKPRRLVIDLTAVQYMDSSGVATLVEAMQISRRNGTRMLITGLQPRVRSIIEIARLDTVFQIVATRDAALKD